MKKLLFFGILIAFTLSCEEAKQNKENPVLPIANSEGLQILPSLPQENIEGLLNNTDYIDLIFHAYGKSINLNEKIGIQNTIRHITNTPQPEISCAAPFCKVIYYKMPNKLLEGEIHYGNGCAYFVFPDAEGKPQYANKLSPSGIAFFNDLITKFNTSANQ